MEATKQRLRLLRRQKIQRSLPLYMMIIPGMLLIFVFNYIPLFGLSIAFMNFTPAKGITRSPFVGFDNFRFVFSLPNTLPVIFNTLAISAMKIVAFIVVPVFVALLLNEVRLRFFKRVVQTIIYMPYFLSWVILAGVFIEILSPSYGIVNKFLNWLGAGSIYFLGDPKVFPATLVFTDVWKEFGFKTIIYLSALAGIDPGLYEAASIDGANRMRQTLHITLPGLAPTIVLMSTLALGQILNAGFEQVFNLYSPQVYSTGDIIDTLVFRIGIEQAQYGIATAIGAFKSVVSCTMLIIGQLLARKFTNYSMF